MSRAVICLVALCFIATVCAQSAPAQNTLAPVQAPAAAAPAAVPQAVPAQQPVPDLLAQSASNANSMVDDALATMKEPLEQLQAEVNPTPPAAAAVPPAMAQASVVAAPVQAPQAQPAAAPAPVQARAPGPVAAPAPALQSNTPVPAPPAQNKDHPAHKHRFKKAPAKDPKAKAASKPDNKAAAKPASKPAPKAAKAPAPEKKGDEEKDPRLQPPKGGKNTVGTCNKMMKGKNGCGPIAKATEEDPVEFYPSGYKSPRKTDDKKKTAKKTTDKKSTDKKSDKKAKAKETAAAAVKKAYKDAKKKAETKELHKLEKKDAKKATQKKALKKAVAKAVAKGKAKGKAKAKKEEAKLQGQSKKKKKKSSSVKKLTSNLVNKLTGQKKGNQNNLRFCKSKGLSFGDTQGPLRQMLNELVGCDEVKASPCMPSKTARSMIEKHLSHDKIKITATLKAWLSAPACPKNRKKNSKDPTRGPNQKEKGMNQAAKHAASKPLQKTA